MPKQIKEADAVTSALAGVVPNGREALSALLDECEVSRITGRSRRTLQGDRVAGGGIPFCRIGRLVRYRREDVERFIADRVVTSTSAARVREEVRA